MSNYSDNSTRIRPSILLLALAALATACAPQTRVIPVGGEVYKITQSGGWGYDLKSLKSGVQQQAKTFASSAGKDLEIIDESTVPDAKVDVYPADDDTYTLTFRLVEKK